MTTEARPLRLQRPGGRSARRLAREFALQGVYAWLLRTDADAAELGEIDAHVRDGENFELADCEWYQTLLQGVISQSDSLRARFSPYIDRPLAELSPIEHAVLLIGSFELVHQIQVPYKVAINESVELAKAFGGTDGYRFVNGVLDRVAAEARSTEVQARA